MRRWFPLLTVVALALLTACSPNRSADALAAGQVTAQESSSKSTEAKASKPDSEALATCPVTLPPDQAFIPPEPYGEPLQGHFWYGSPALWTSLPLDGIWRDLPKREVGYGQKLPWWKQGYDWRAEPEPDLTVTGRRLDGDAPPLVSPKASNAFAEDFGSAMMVGFDIPSAGCWEITGSINGQELSFVVQVIGSDN
jgi:hypothetical protein